MTMMMMITSGNDAANDELEPHNSENTHFNKDV